MMECKLWWTVSWLMWSLLFVWRTHTHTHPTVLLLFWNMSGTTRVSRYQKGKTRKVKTNLDLLEQEIVSGSGICWAMFTPIKRPFIWDYLGGPAPEGKTSLGFTGALQTQLQIFKRLHLQYRTSDQLGSMFQIWLILSHVHGLSKV